MRPRPSHETLAPRPRDPSSRGPGENTPAAISSLEAPAAAPALELVQGIQVGRYTIDRLLGRGGMGVVYVAIDRELGRKVAIKVLRDADVDAEARLRREAQVMAQLAHPNVLVVHEAGTVEGTVYVASELVDGAALDVWLRAAPRGWRETLALFVQAGRGLAAAHAAGIVHRDVKPANIFVGADGRARVGDFGLARATGEAEAPRREASDAGSDPGLTQTGTVLGTPAYMAPEQRRGERATPLSDQYSFCLALHEGLTGARMAVGTWPPPFPGRPPLPARLRAAITRGLELDPGRRHPTMDALLAALVAVERPASRARLAVAAAALAAAVAVPLALAATRRTPPAADPCAGDAARLDSVWGPGRAAELERAFLATKLPFAPATFKSAGAALDRYAGRWLEQRRAACATEPTLGAAQLACLDQRLQDMGATVNVLASGGKPAVTKGPEVVKGLAELDLCAHPDEASAPVPQDPAVRLAVGTLRTRLAGLKARRKAGLVGEEMDRGLAEISDAARRLSYRPLEAEALTAQGLQQVQNGDYAGAARQLQVAVQVAEETRYDVQKATGWAGLASAYSLGYKYPEAHAACDLARAVLRRLGGAFADHTWAVLDQAEAQLLSGERRFDEAIVHALSALARDETRVPLDETAVAYSAFVAGYVFGDAGRLDEADAYYRRSLGTFREINGREHPVVMKILNNLGTIAFMRRAYPDALALFEESLAIAGKVMPPDYPGFGDYHNNIGAALNHLGRCAEALPHLRQARDIYAARFGLDAELMTEPLSNIGACLHETGDDAAAIATLERALELCELRRPESATHADVRLRLAQALWSRPAARVRARGLAEQARELYARDPGKAPERAAAEAWLAGR